MGTVLMLRTIRKGANAEHAFVPFLCKESEKRCHKNHSPESMKNKIFKPYPFPTLRLYIKSERAMIVWGCSNTFSKTKIIGRKKG
jgi:hypothetical protein